VANLLRVNEFPSCAHGAVGRYLQHDGVRAFQTEPHASANPLRIKPSTDGLDPGHRRARRPPEKTVGLLRCAADSTKPAAELLDAGEPIAGEARQPRSAPCPTVTAATTEPPVPKIQNQDADAALPSLFG
jgi:hypothetical protein